MKKTAKVLSKQEIFIKYATKFRGEYILTEPSAMAAMEEYHNQFRPVLPTDEKIAITFPIYEGDENELLDEINQYRREGAKWMRDQIKNQLENKE